MKRLALLVGLVLLSVVGTTTTSRAYYLDTPHNESNGIYCNTCHDTAPFYLTAAEWAARTAANPDDTLRNAVCLMCHDANSTNALKGPSKMLHGSSTNPGSATIWSTECTQCHDMHAQGQLDWAGPLDDGKLFLASGSFVTIPGLGGTARVYNAAGNYTTIGISATITGDPEWIDTTKWSAKGGKMDPTRARDNSRGLILVPNMGAPNETFEIIDVTPTLVNGIQGYLIKVKGQMVNDASQGGNYGVIYGQALKSLVMPNGGTTAADYRNVKFFKPDLNAGTYGGYVDLTPSVAKPVGLCQVCHDSTAHWKNDGTSPVPHNPGTVCSTCHDVLTGSAGKGADHTLKIVNYNSGGADCSVCHPVTSDPVADIHANATNLVTGGTGCAVCHDAPSPTALNTNVAGRLGVTPSFGDDGTWPVTCAGCHPEKPGQLTAVPPTHGGHANTDFGWGTANCIDCHTGTNVVADVHKNHCTDCHDTSGTNGYKVRKAGDSTFGIDGTAVGATISSVCVDCHNTQATVGAIHHVSQNGLAATSCTTQCHAVANHKGNHSATVADYVNCTSCHAANVGGNGTVGAPVDPANNKVHDSCYTCHNTDASLKTLAQVGGVKVIAMPNPGALSTDGGGTCVICHGEYFDNHSNINHNTSRVTNSCSGCHTTTAVGAARTAVTSPFTGAGQVHATNGCKTCHQTNGLLKTSAPKAPGLVAGGGSCNTCHIAGATTWTSIHTASPAVSHTTKVTLDVANCGGCHTTTTPGSSALAKDAVTAPFVGAGEAHNTNGCGTCHNTTSGATLAPYGRAVAITGGGSCSTCHINGTTKTWSTVHSSFATAMHTNVIATASCATCHGNPTPATSNARDAQVAPYIVAGDVHGTGCALCHNTTNGSRIVGANGKGDATVAAGADGKWECADCHTATWVITHTARTGVDHTGRVDGLAACTSCHTATAGSSAGVMPVSATDNKVHDGCTVCHQATGALNSGNTTYGAKAIAKGDCGTCHGATYFDNHVHGTTGGYVTHDVTYNPTLDLAQAAPGTGCASCHTPTGTLSTWAGILDEHTGGCARCHSYTNADGQNSPPLNTTTSTIATGTAVHCVTCHTEKMSPATHGGHPTDFGKTAYCVTCHTGASVLVNIHGDGATATCTICHSGTPSRDTEKAGDPTFGIDGDATLANGTAAAGTWASVNCLTCHTPGNGANTATSTGGIHHVNKSGNVNCTTSGCHSASKLTHTNTVVTDANCNSCHDAVAANGNARDAITAPFIGTGEVHLAKGGCTACHQIAAVGSAGDLRTGVTGITLSNNGTSTGVNGTDGGGTCSTCHGVYFANHKNANHTSLVSLATNCADCHTGTAGTSTTVPVSGTDNKLHDSCATCHAANGTLLAAYGRAQAMPNGGAGSGNGGGTCEACHTLGFTGFHQTVAHTTMVTMYTNCSSCHTAVGNTVDPADPKVHDACSVCHGANGRLIGSALNKNGGDNGGTNGGGTCFVCHGEYFDSHVHGTTGGYVSHAVTFNAAVDISQTGGASNSCYNCHDDAGLGKGTNALSTWAAIKTEHATIGGVAQTSACATCHSYATVGNQSGAANTPPLTNVTTAIATKTGDTCVSCHVEKSFALNPSTSSHGGHAATDFAWTAATQASCGGSGRTVKCHDYSVNTDVVKQVHGNTCGLCHNSASGGDARRIGPGGDANAALADGNPSAICTVCHSIRPSVGAMHHDTKPAANNDCTTNCHNTSVAKHGVTAILDSPNCNAQFCHASPNFDGSNDSAAGTLPTSSATAGAALIDPTNPMKHDACRSCHTFAADLSGTLRAVADVTGKKGVTAMVVGDCTKCHTQATATFHHLNVNAANGYCSECHNDPRNDAYTASTAYNLAPPATIRTNQLVCDECHVTPLANTTGWTGSMTISAWNEGGTHSTTGYSTAFTRTVAHSGGHVIPNTAGTIDDWGICFSCHDGAAEGKAISQIKPLHAQPTVTVPTCQGRYTPGNPIGTTSAIGRFYFLGSKWRPAATGSGKCSSDYTSFTSATTVGTGIRGAVTTYNVPDPWATTSTTVGVPTWTTAPAVPTRTMPVSALPINVSSANLVGTTLTVTATVTGGTCANLNLVYTGGPTLFTGTTTCTATKTGYDLATNGSTVDVTYPSADSIAVIKYPITAAATSATAVNDTLTAAISGVTNLLVMANDSGTGITITSVTQPSLGSVAISGGTSINYTGAGAGTTSFTYTITASNSTTSTATVNLTMAADSTPPTVGTVTVTPTATTYTSSAPVITATLTDAQSSVSACEYTTNGSTWVAGVVSGAASPWTCTGSPTGLTGSLTINVRGTSVGGLGTGVAVTRTVDTTAPTTGVLTVTPGNAQNGLSWTASTDAGLGMRATNTYDVRFLTGATAPTCSTGTSIYTGTALTTTHTALTNGTQYSYRVCAYDAGNNVSTGATGSGTPASGPSNITALQDFPATPQFNGTTANLSGTYTMSAGTNRLLIVAVGLYDSAGGTGQTFAATYGGRALTQAVIENSNRRVTWIGYLNEAGIAAATSSTLAVTVTGAHTNVSASAATYQGVNQTTPIAGSSSLYGNNTAAAYAFPAAVTTTVGDMGIYAFASTSARSSDTESYVEKNDYANGLQMGVATKSMTVAGTTQPTVTYAATTRASQSIIVLNY